MVCRGYWLFNELRHRLSDGGSRGACNERHDRVLSPLRTALERLRLNHRSVGIRARAGANRKYKRDCNRSVGRNSTLQPSVSSPWRSRGALDCNLGGWLLPSRREASAAGAGACEVPLDAHLSKGVGCSVFRASSPESKGAVCRVWVARHTARPAGLQPGCH
jgi:hypothetical protein